MDEKVKYLIKINAIKELIADLHTDLNHNDDVMKINSDVATALRSVSRIQKRVSNSILDDGKPKKQSSKKTDDFSIPEIKY